MHPRQVSVRTQAQTVVAKVSSKAAAAPVPALTGPVLLWKYQDPDGNKFYLEIKRTTIKSPFSGKSFSTRPERYTPAQVGKELKDERKNASENASESLVEYVNRLAAGQIVLWQYADPEGNMFWLDRRVTTAIRSPYGGSPFISKPKKVLPSQVGKILKEELQKVENADSGMDDPADPQALKAFAGKVLMVAKSAQSKKFHHDRVFIASVKDLGFPHMPRPTFDAMLIKAHQSGLLRMTRADLVGAMDPVLVEQSEVRFQSATFNFIAIDDAGRW